MTWKHSLLSRRSYPESHVVTVKREDTAHRSALRAAGSSPKPAGLCPPRWPQSWWDGDPGPPDNTGSCGEPGQMLPKGGRPGAGLPGRATTSPQHTLTSGTQASPLLAGTVPRVGVVVFLSLWPGPR